jgi:HD-GYP domain-containing protein (c-di-GMP phosphodiesterase class II)
MTSGHSAKVTEYALGISDEMGLPKDYREAIRVAALLHDYGKIGIPDTILKKPGRLTDEEYEIVKTHTDKTRRILEQINFEGIYSLVPEIAGCHHEKFDGSGYPNGLIGDEIPLGSRIIAVADFFEAITAERHYRGPMELDKAFDLLLDGAGRRFDPEVVDALCRFYAREHAGPTECRLLVS